MKRFHFFFLFAISLVQAFSQDIKTASALFNEVSDRYATIGDYTARVVITQGNVVQMGNLVYKNPNRVRIDFFDPRGQVIVSDGRTLTVYVPAYAVAFTQDVGSGNVANMASRQGLNILRNNFSISFASSPTPQPLQQGSSELVRKLRLTWKSADEAFRQIDLAIAENGLIRRITGVTVNYKTVQLDLTDIEVNTGVGDGRFQYESPPNANRIHNYLFEPDA